MNNQVHIDSLMEKGIDPYCIHSKQAESTDQFSSAKPNLSSGIFTHCAKELLIELIHKTNGTTGKKKFLNSDKYDNFSKHSFQTLINRFLPSLPYPIGFKFGKSLNLIAAGELGSAIVTAKNLREVCQILFKYRDLIPKALHFDLKIENQQIRLVFSKILHSSMGKNEKCFLAEALIGFIGYQSRWLCRTDFKFSQVYLPYANPGYNTGYNEILECEVEFDHSSDQNPLDVVLCFDECILDIPIPSHNRAVNKVHLEVCNQLLIQESKNIPLSIQIERILTNSLPSKLSVESICRTFNISKSVLYRRLQREGISFQQIVNRTKSKLALDLLRNSQLPIPSISDQLGFRDPACFRRAFKSWTGKPPSNFRNLST